MDLRAEARKGWAAPVRVFGLDAGGRPFTHNGFTVDVSVHGARIELATGAGLEHQVLGVRYRTEKTRFRVVWAERSVSATSQQVGLYCVEAGAYIWDVIPVQEGIFQAVTGDANCERNSSLYKMESRAPSRDRRLEERHSIGGSAQLRNCSSNAADWATLYDLSRNGCYVETRGPWPVGTRVEVILDVGAIKVEASAQVITSHPLVGMGFRFLQISRLNQDRLDHLFALIRQKCEDRESAGVKLPDEEFEPAAEAGTNSEGVRYSGGKAVTLARLIRCTGGDGE